MPAPNDLETRARQIKDLVGADEITQALSQLIDLTREFRREHENESIVLRATYANLEKRERLGVIAYDEASRQRTQLLFRILALVDIIEERPDLARAS